MQELRKLTMQHQMLDAFQEPVEATETTEKEEVKEEKKEEVD